MPNHRNTQKRRRRRRRKSRKRNGGANKFNTLVAVASNKKNEENAVDALLSLSSGQPASPVAGGSKKGNPFPPIPVTEHTFERTASFGGKRHKKRRRKRKRKSRKKNH